MPCPHGKQFPSQCKDCGSKSFCVHGKRKRRCAECDGRELCTHGRIKYSCKDCKGSALCPHSRVKSECKECGGSRYCEHGKRRSRCIDCNGNDICKHKKRKENCKECGGSAYCEHGKFKHKCKECDGTLNCVHNLLKYLCKECDGRYYCEHDKLHRSCEICGSIEKCRHSKIKTVCEICSQHLTCPHGKIKKNCKDCGGSAYCVHKKLKPICKECGGKRLCIHNKNKIYCKECDGSACCKSTWCSTIPSNKKYDGYCLVCYIHLFPDKPLTRNYKTKERNVADFVKSEFPEQTWIHDKRILDGCSARRPDLLCDLGDQVLMIEVDEGKHAKYDCSCENKRIMELSKDVGHRPIVLIRFNPDSYTDEYGKTHRSCWRHNKFGTCSITLRDAWANRLKCLKETITYWIENRTDKTIETIYLYFSCLKEDTKPPTEASSETEEPVEVSPLEENIDVIEHI